MTFTICRSRFYHLRTSSYFCCCFLFFKFFYSFFVSTVSLTFICWQKTEQYYHLTTEFVSRGHRGQYYHSTTQCVSKGHRRQYCHFTTHFACRGHSRQYCHFTAHFVSRGRRDSIVILPQSLLTESIGTVLSFYHRIC